MMRLRTVAILAVLSACGGNGDSISPPAGDGKATFHLASKSASDTIEALLPSAIQVTVIDGRGQPLSGALVNLRVIPDRVYVEPGVRLYGTKPDTLVSARTPSSGTLRVDVALGIHSGTTSVVASVGGIDRQDTVTFTVLPGAPDSLRLATEDTLVTFDAPYRPAMTVTDRKGNVRSDTPTLSSSSDACRVSSGVVTASRVSRCVVTARVAAATDSMSILAMPPGRATVVMGTLSGRWIGTMNLDGSNVKLIHAMRGTPLDPMHPVLAPSGEMAAMDFGTDNKAHIVIVEPSGDGRFLPVDLPIDAEENWPVLSPDGQWVYFSACVPQYLENCRVWQTRLDGSQAKILTPSTPLTGQRSTWADIAPDGNSLVYAGWGEHVHLLNLQTGDDVDLGFTSEVFSIDPTGTQTASIRYVGSVLRSLVVANLDGTNARTLAPGTGFYDTAQWLPGREWILSGLMIQDGPNSAHSGSRVLVNVNTGELIPFTYSGPVIELYILRK